MEWQRDSLLVSDDPARIDLDVVHGFLREVYWAKGIPRETVQRSIDNSMCFSIFENGNQIGFARVITDKTTFGYLSDVFVLESHRGKGASRCMLDCIMNHPELANLPRWMLLTDDAHGLYRKFGFEDIAQPHRHMEVSRPKPYGNR
ncbi:MAG TPA: GNAT family N-acetyltransferase [Thermoanaerobaculia bacterium]|nr:GNAT family N-acetyltransferase [Thermoanaerobaculia bacterium]